MWSFPSSVTFGATGIACGLGHAADLTAVDDTSSTANAVPLLPLEKVTPHQSPSVTASPQGEASLLQWNLTNRTSSSSQTIQSRRRITSREAGAKANYVQRSWGEGELLHSRWTPHQSPSVTASTQGEGSRLRVTNEAVGENDLLIHRYRGPLVSPAGSVTLRI